MSWGMVAVGVGTVAAGAIQADAASDAAAAQGAAANRSAAAQAEAEQRARDAWDGATAESRALQNEALARYIAGQQGALGTSLDAQRSALDAILAGQEPYRAGGRDAMSQLRALMNYDPTPTAESVMAEPGYQFGLTQGRNALEGSAAAAGGLYSGQALRELTQFGNDYATTKYGDAFNRQQTAFGNQWNRIAALAGMGQQAEGAAGSAQQAYGNNVSNLVGGNADRVGNAILGNAGNQTSLLTNRASAIGNLATGTANNLSNIWMNNANAQAAAQLQQGQIIGGGINQLAGLAAYGTTQQNPRTNQSAAWQWGGPNGTNDRSWFSGGNAQDWFNRYGTSGD